MTERKAEVPSTIGYGGPFGTVPELLFEKKQIISALQQMPVSLYT
jgi:hypothetical protein